jgi:hypothetical protein
VKEKKEHKREERKEAKMSPAMHKRMEQKEGMHMKCGGKVKKK